MPRSMPSLGKCQRNLRERRGRMVVASLGGLMLFMPGITGLSALGLPLAVAVPVTLAIGGAAVWVTARRLPARLEQLPRSRPVLVGLWVVLAITAILQTGRLGTYMHDVGRPQHSILPANEFLVAHSCLTAYTEADRLAYHGLGNIYAPDASGDTIGPLRVDRYQYPPPFLLLPRGYEALTGDFFRTRAAWFATQTVVLAGALAAAARWVGGATGLRIALLAPVVLVAPTTLLTLQVGNHQVTVYAMAILGMLGMATRHVALGAALLAFAVISKIFPGVLLVYLLVRQQWRAAAWTGTFILVFALAPLAIFGTRPYMDFFQYQLPRLASGEAFRVIDLPLVAAENHSIYGLVTKLRHLGVASANPAAGRALASVYTAALLVVTVWIARRCAGGDCDLPNRRAAEIITWLALLSLAAFRSPFTPDLYAFFGTVWMLMLLAARARGFRAAALRLVAIVPFAWTANGLVTGHPPAWLLLTGLAMQVAAIALGVWCLLQRSPAGEGSTRDPTERSAPAASLRLIRTGMRSRPGRSRTRA